MNSRQLYRYLFSDEELSPAEIEKIPAFFQPFMSSKTSILFNLVRLRRLDYLAGPLNIQIPKNYDHYVPHDKSLYNIDNIYRYYKDPKRLQHLQPLYTMALHICLILGTNDQAMKFAYFMTVLFGNETKPEEMFALFDVHCAGGNFTTLENAFAFDLPERTDDAPLIDLPVWRKLIQPSVQQNLRLFAIAHEVEAKLKRPPKTLEEAYSAAQERLFADTEKDPKLAKFCAHHLVPERNFADFFNLERVDTDSFATLYALIPSEKKLDFVFLVGDSLNCCVSFENLLGIVDLLPDIAPSDLSIPTNQSKFFLKFKDQTIIYCRNNTLEKILNILQTTVSQAELLLCLGESIVRELVPLTKALWGIFKCLNADLFEYFLQLLGKDKINALIYRADIMQEFFARCLPKQSKIECLVTYFDVDKLREFNRNDIPTLDANHPNKTINCLEHNLEILGEDESFEFVTQILKLDHVMSILKQTPPPLSLFLSRFANPVKMEFLLEFLGVDNLKKIIPYEKRKEIANQFLAPNDRKNFKEALLTNIEKYARDKIFEVKASIIAIKFVLGFYGMGPGGVTITLDDGTPKLVPTTVAQHWNIAVEACEEKRPFDTAWDEILTSGRDAAKHASSKIKYLVRNDTTVEYYAQFAAAEPTLKDICSFNPSP